MIVGYHVSFSAYGFWLPNDPRGSWSQFVGKWELYHAAGRATRTIEARSLARRPHNRALRLATKRELDRPPVRFTSEQVASIGQAFAEHAAKSDLVVWACAIMPDHVHVVFARHRLEPKEAVNKLKGAATARLVDDEVHPFQHLKPAVGPPPKRFAQGEWVIFIDPEDVAWHVEYVENNPVKAGLARQGWNFVQRPELK